MTNLSLFGKFSNSAKKLIRTIVGYTSSTNSYILYSEDNGITWSVLQTISTTNAYLAKINIDSNYNHYVSNTSTYGNTNTTYYSEDGKNIYISKYSFGLFNYNKGMYVGGLYSSSIGYIYYSKDKITWTIGLSISGYYPSDIIKAGDYFLVAMTNASTQSTAILYTSTDGITWTQLTSTGLSSSGTFNFAYGNNTYVITCASGKHVLYSIDNLATFVDSTISYYPYGLTYGNGLFVIVCSSGKIYTSPDGITWTSRTSPTTDNLHSVSYKNNLFIAVGNSSTVGTSASIITSPDGITWTSRTSPTTNALYGVI